MMEPTTFVASTNDSTRSSPPLLTRNSSTLLSPPAVTGTVQVTPVATGGLTQDRDSSLVGDADMLMKRQQQLMLYSHHIDNDKFSLTENLKKVISEVMNIKVLPGTKFLPREKKTSNGELVFPSFARPDFTSGKFPLPELILKECGKWHGDLATCTYWWRVIYPEVAHRINQDRNRIQSYMKENIITGK